MVDQPVSFTRYMMSDDDYDPDDPENYSDVGEMVRQVTGDDPDTPQYDDADEELNENWDSDSDADATE